MVKIDISTWGTDVDTHTNQNKSKFFNLTPSSQGAGLDIEFQNSLQNSDYEFRKDPQGAISAEMERQKVKGIVFRFKDRRALKNNMGFKAPNLKDVVKNIQTASAGNYMAIVNDQIDNEKFEQNIQKYFDITGLQQFDQNMGVLFDTLKKHGIMMEDERQRIEEMIRNGDIRIIQDETIAQKVVQDRDLMYWTTNFVKYFKQAQKGMAAAEAGKQIYNIITAFIKKLMDYLRSMRVPVPRAFEVFVGGGGPPPPGGGGGYGGAGRARQRVVVGRPGQGQGNGGGGGPPGGGGYGGGSGGSGMGGSGSGMSGSGGGGIPPEIASSAAGATTNSGHNVDNVAPGGTLDPNMSAQQAGNEYANRMSQADASLDTSQLPQPRFTGQESTRPSELDISSSNPQTTQGSSPPPEGLGDHENMLYEAFTALLMSRSTFQAVGLATAVGMNAVIANTLRHNMPGRFRDQVLEVIRGGRPIILMVQQLIHMGGTNLVNALVRSFYGNMFNQAVDDLADFMAAYIRDFMNAGLPDPNHVPDFTLSQEIERTSTQGSEASSEVITSDLTDYVLQSINDNCMDIINNGVTSTDLEQFTNIVGFIENLPVMEGSNPLIHGESATQYITGDMVFSNLQDIFMEQVTRVTQSAQQGMSDIMALRLFLDLVRDNTNIRAPFDDLGVDQPNYSRPANEILQKLNTVINLVEEFLRNQASTSGRQASATSESEIAEAQAEQAVLQKSQSAGTDFSDLSRADTEVIDLMGLDPKTSSQAFINKYNQLTGKQQLITILRKLEGSLRKKRSPELIRNNLELLFTKTRSKQNVKYVFDQMGRDLSAREWIQSFTRTAAPRAGMKDYVLDRILNALANP